MRKIPVDASPEVQDAFRELWDALEKLTGLNVDWHGVVMSNIGSPVRPTDAATKAYVDDRMKERVI